ncbi:MAG: PAS domain-containing protein [Acidimicrobiia bacterium]|nr:PAS domain-containing protein [Acidimicrobiia bacterium]
MGDAVELDMLPDPVLRLDADRVITAANAAAVELVGSSSADALVGRALLEVLDPHDGDGRSVFGACWPTSAALRSVTSVPELTLTVSIDGDRLPVRVTARYERDADGALTGALLALRAPRRGEQREPSGAEVVSTVSHELRSPLTSVKGYTSLLLNRWDRVSDDQKQMMLRQVHHDADRVTRLITELLDISRLETGRLVLRRQMVDVADLAATVVERLAVTYTDLACEVVFPAGFPTVYADPDKLEQVLTNLVENGAKYGSPVGMRVVGTVGEDAVEVAVSDVGDGIPAVDLRRVFRKFFRRDQGKPTGTGLGLWISRGLVEAHGGRLSATSVEGAGATFRFTIPLVDVDALLAAGSNS